MHKRAFGNGTQGIAFADGCTGFYRRCKVPQRFVGQRVKVDAAFQKKARFFGKLRKRVLQTVEYLPQKARPQFNRKHVAGKGNFVAGLDTLRHFKNLHLSLIAPNADNFAFKAFARDFNVADLVQGYDSVKLNTDHVAVDADDLSFCIRHVASPSILS